MREKNNKYNERLNEGTAKNREQKRNKTKTRNQEREEKKERRRKALIQWKPDVRDR